MCGGANIYIEDLERARTGDKEMKNNWGEKNVSNQLQQSMRRSTCSSSTSVLYLLAVNLFRSNCQLSNLNKLLRNEGEDPSQRISVHMGEVN